MLRETFAVARKESRGFCASPGGCIFIGGFLAATLFNDLNRLGIL